MSLLVVCEDCAREYDVLECAAGRKMRCRCGTVLNIPSSADAEPSDEWHVEPEPRAARTPAATRSPPVAKTAAAPRRSRSQASVAFLDWLTSPPVVITGFCLALVLLGGIVSAARPELQHTVAAVWLIIGLVGFLASILFFVAAALEEGVIWVLLVLFVPLLGPLLFFLHSRDRCREILFFKFAVLFLMLLGTAVSSVGGMLRRGTYDYSLDFPLNRPFPQPADAAQDDSALEPAQPLGNPLADAKPAPQPAAVPVMEAVQVVDAAPVATAAGNTDPVLAEVPQPAPGPPIAVSGIPAEQSAVAPPVRKVLATFQLVQFDKELGAAEAAQQALAAFTELENVTLVFTRSSREAQMVVPLPELPRLWPLIQRALERAGFQVVFQGHRAIGAKTPQPAGPGGAAAPLPQRTMSPSF